MSQKIKNDKSLDQQQGKLKHKQKNYLYTGIFLTIVLILFVVNNYNGEPEQGPYPPYYLESLSENLKLSDYKGKIVLLNFWTTGSKQSRENVSNYIEIKNKFNDREFEIIGVSLDGIAPGENTKKDVIPFMKELGINYPVVYGTSKMMYDYGGIHTIPTAFVLNTEGKVVSHYQGKVDKTVIIKDIESVLNGLSAGKEMVIAPEFELSIVEIDK